VGQLEEGEEVLLDLRLEAPLFQDQSPLLVGPRQDSQGKREQAAVGQKLPGRM